MKGMKLLILYLKKMIILFLKKMIILFLKKNDYLKIIIVYYKYAKE